MNFEKELAKNGEETLKANNVYIYSKYAPKKDAERWIEQQVDIHAQSYILVGFGLGYHLEALQAKVGNKPIQVLSLFKEHEQFMHNMNSSNVMITSEGECLTIDEYVQILIPQVWLTIMSKDHPLYNIFANIKMKQTSYKRFASTMELNFHTNIQAQHYITLNEFRNNNTSSKKRAFLIASGPSLDERIDALKQQAHKAYVLCVGSALKVLLKHQIVPDAVIISDCQDTIYEQIRDTQYEGDLFFLCTANANTIKQHIGRRILLLQSGYRLAEQYAKNINEVLLETGGSVSTTAFSLLANLEFEEIYLFGLDLAIAEHTTHAQQSTSNRDVLQQEKLIYVEGNRQNKVPTLPNLFMYLQWFEWQANKSNMTVYNLCPLGAKIKGTQYVTLPNFEKLLSNGD